jgi:5-deoxy-glucuronate isomerase
MSELHRRATQPGPDGTTVRVDPATEPADLGGAGWHWISFAAHELDSGIAIVRPGDNHEVAIVALEGSVGITAGGTSFADVGSRASVFDSTPPPVFLAEPGLQVEVTASGPASVLVASAIGGSIRETRLIEPASMRIEERGAGQTARTVRHLLPPEARAGRLIIVEVMTPGGNWSSYPPHKHDVDDPPVECLLEELYYYRFRRPAGFAFQRVYTTDRVLDESLTPMDGDVVLVPRGFHPVGVPAGYDAYYLNVMAGPVREWRFTLDPDHAWLMDWDPRAPDA